ncbi:unnamed protein product [Mycetohabitans rhizoxinica HKI 454]|uniref:Uncharacterized protein n=1 Tax=Mycetohabitans rhizoxinica (strain DSM 19002 / CIP 109453 / HKI 454) TaxID=882378 RepID=E5ASR1_MYCRK|nr:unnamed protein product [Mycetohabitans rhizoxinica HKI 454]
MPRIGAATPTERAREPSRLLPVHRRMHHGDVTHYDDSGRATDPDAPKHWPQSRVSYLEDADGASHV